MPTVLAQLGRTASPVPLADAVALSGTVSVPQPHTLRRLLVQLDGDALDRAIGAFLTARAAPAGPDFGRSPLTARLCAAHAPASPGTSPCSPRWTTPATPWSSARSPTRGTRSPPSGPAGQRRPDPTGTVITADALRIQHAHDTYLRQRGAHHIAHVKANHPGLFDTIRRLPWREITLDHYDRTRAHPALAPSPTSASAPRSGGVQDLFGPL